MARSQADSSEDAPLREKGVAIAAEEDVAVIIPAADDEAGMPAPAAPAPLPARGDDADGSEVAIVATPASAKRVSFAAAEYFVFRSG